MSLLLQPRSLIRQELKVSMDSIKMEKAKAMEGFNNSNSRHRTLKNLMLLFELCLGLVMASWLLTCVFTWIPLAVQISAAHLSSSFRSSLCVFLFCNAVILLIVFLSSLTNSASSAPPRPDIYEEFVAANQTRRRPSPKSPAPEQNHVLSSSENNAASSALSSVSLFDEVITEYALAPETDSVKPLPVKVYQRTQSDNSGMELVERKQLRRSETEKVGRAAVEELSNEEFRLKIEAFIAAQKCNLMKEHKCTDMVLRR